MSSNVRDARKFVYQQEQDMYTIQTQDLFLQVEFRSCVKEISEYLEQYQKYAFKAALSSINLKSFQHDAVYTYVKQSIMFEFDEFMEKTMQFIQDMMMNIHFMKVQKWHYFCKIIQGFKTQLLNKDMDCYDFNVKQFDEDYNKVLELLKQYKVNRKREEVVKLKEQLRDLTKKIQKVQENKLKNKFVKHPYRSQNQHKKDINTSTLFATYFRDLQYKSDCINEGFQLSHFSLHQNILNFYDSVVEFSLRNQRLASNIIGNYNDRSSKEQVNYINPKKYEVTERQFVDANDINLQWCVRDTRPAALINRKEKVKFGNTVMMHDEVTNEDQILTCVFQDKERIYNMNQEEDFFTNAECGYDNIEFTEYYNPFEYTYNRIRMKDHPLGIQNNLRQYYQQKYNEKVVNFKQKLYYRPRRLKEVKFRRLYDEQSHFASGIAERRDQEKKIWKVKMKGQFRTMYEFPIQTREQKYYKTMPYHLNEADKKKFDQNVQEKIKMHKQTRYEKNRQFQEGRRGEEERKLQRKSIILKQKTYKVFAKKVGLQNFHTEMQGDKIYRYEKLIYKNPDLNKSYKDVEEFFAFYFKERFFREGQNINEKGQIPILYNSKSAQQFTNAKTVSILLKQTQKLKFFIIWGSQVIIYEERRTTKKNVQGKFTIYAYSNVNNSRCLMFELKRKAQIQITGEVICLYCSEESDNIKKALSKLQVVHRQIKNMHMKTENFEESYEKGRQVYKRIMLSLEREIREDSIVIDDDK